MAPVSAPNTIRGFPGAAAMLTGFFISLAQLNQKGSQSQSPQLKFGIFTWTEPYENIAGCGIDKIPWLMWYGGAGIHYMLIQKRYHASFNFLEYPRVVVALKKKSGPVCGLSFTTRHPEKVLQLLQQLTSPQKPSGVDISA